MINIKIIMSLILISGFFYSQDCDEGFTYIASFPDNITNINNDYNCFYEDDLEVLNSVYELNNLQTNYDSYLNLGKQTWVTSRLTVWVATFIQNGSNGITKKIDILPDNFGNLTSLNGLYIEKHDINTLPVSFSSLTSLVTLFINTNWLTSLPTSIGNLTNLQTLDLGYNQLESIPESIGNLENLEYLFLFNNNLTILPETICNLNLDWDGVSTSNYPYFASGGNSLCVCDLIPDCVENSTNINISMEPNYYSFLLDAPQDCSDSSENCSCPNLGDINGDGGYNVLDIVVLSNCVLATDCNNLTNSCAADMNLDGGYNVLDIVVLANCVLATDCG